MKQLDAKTFLVFKPNLWDIWVIKYLARPYLKFLNSTKIKLFLIFVNQHPNFPFPLPILVPVGFFVSGRWGKAWNQVNRLVISLFFDARFRKSLKRKIWREVNWEDWRSLRPAPPYFKDSHVYKFFCFANIIFLFFCFFL